MKWYYRWKTNRLKEKLLALKDKQELIMLEYNIKVADNNLNKLILEVKLKKISEDNELLKAGY